MFSFLKKMKSKKAADDSDEEADSVQYLGELALEPKWPLPVRPTVAHGTTYPRKLNDSVFEFYVPERQPKLDIVFFHGLQLGSYKNAYLETWQTGETCWPQVWLAEDFPRARILSISYDSSARRSKDEGHVDLPKVGEILVEDVIISAGVGAHCPVILVGHSLGGIVIKQLCLEAERNQKSHHRNKYIKRFMKHIRGIFYYAVPHGGSQLANLAKNYIPSLGPMLDYLTVLSIHTEEINEAFVQLRQARRWRAAAVGENLITRIGWFGAMVVTEASASRDVDSFTLLEDDHMTICKPKDTSAPSYVLLQEFILECVSR